MNSHGIPHDDVTGALRMLEEYTGKLKRSKKFKADSFPPFRSVEQWKALSRVAPLSKVYFEVGKSDVINNAQTDLYILPPTGVENGNELQCLVSGKESCQAETSAYGGGSVEPKWKLGKKSGITLAGVAEFFEEMIDEVPVVESSFAQSFLLVLSDKEPTMKRPSPISGALAFYMTSTEIFITRVAIIKDRQKNHLGVFLMSLAQLFHKAWHNERSSVSFPFIEDVVPGVYLQASVIDVSYCFFSYWDFN